MKHLRVGDLVVALAECDGTMSDNFSFTGAARLRILTRAACKKVSPVT